MAKDWLIHPDTDAEKDYASVLKWESEEIDKVYAKLKEQGYVSRLGADPEEVRAVHKEARRRLEALKEKYGY